MNMLKGKIDYSTAYSKMIAARLFLALLLILFIGCAPSQMRKLVFGFSLHDFDTAEKKYTKIIDMKPADCFKQAKDILVKMPASIEKSDSRNNFIVALGFNDFFKSSPSVGDNTTEVGILFKDVSEGKTEMVVISDDYRLGEFVANALFEGLAAKKDNS